MLTTLPRHTGTDRLLEVAPGLDLWTCAFDGDAMSAPLHAERLVVLVALAGTINIVSEGRATRRVQPGQVAVIHAQEHFVLDGRASATGGTQGRIVGFSICESLSDLFDQVPVFGPESVPDAAMVALADALCGAILTGTARANAESVKLELRAFAERRARFAPLDELARAKRSFDRRLPEALSMPDFAATIGWAPVRFARAFAKRYGTTPVHYRVRRRMYEAARLLLLAPEASVLDAAFAVGALDLRFFKRAFRATFGMTATELRSGYVSISRPAQSALVA